MLHQTLHIGRHSSGHDRLPAAIHARRLESIVFRLFTFASLYPRLHLHPASAMHDRSAFVFSFAFSGACTHAVSHRAGTAAPCLKRRPPGIFRAHYNCRRGTLSISGDTPQSHRACIDFSSNREGSSAPTFIESQGSSASKRFVTSDHHHYHDRHSSESDDNSADLQYTDASFGSSSGSGDASGSDGGSSSRGRGGGSEDANEDLPDDLREALKLGIVGGEAVKRFRDMAAIPFVGAALKIPAFRTRMLADSSFIFKLFIQELVGNGTALASEIAVRGKDIMHELEYVASDLIVGTVVEAAFVWLLAPTLALPSQNVQGKLARFIESLPANAFVPSTAVRSYNLAQRMSSFVYAGMQYAAIGFVAGIVGTAITYGLIEARKKIDKSYMPERPLPDVIPNSLAWGAFMALSSNTRFQIVEGLERAIAMLFKGTSAPAVNAGIVALRFGNNYWGGVQFVKFFRFLGLHAVAEADGHAQGKS